MKKTHIKWMKKSIIALFMIIACLYMGSFLHFNDVLAQSYQSSSAWYGNDIGVTTLQSFTYDSDYVSFSEIMDDASNIDTSKTYVLETAYELYKFSESSRTNNAYLSLDYVLGNDIDYFDALKENLNYLFNPVGYSQAFSGTFDGQGYEITNLIFRSINTDDAYNTYMPGLIYYAMFSKVSSTGEVKNLGLINPLIVQALNIGAMTYVSTLVGLNQGMVENVYYVDQREESSGINAEGEFIISGLVSVNTGTLRNAYIATPYVKSNAVYQNLSSNVITYSQTGTLYNVYYDQEILLDEDSATIYGTGLNTIGFQTHSIFSSTWFFKDSYYSLTNDSNQYAQLEIDETYPILQGLNISNDKLMISDAVDFIYMNELLQISGLFRQSTYSLDADIDMNQVSENAYVAAGVSFSGTLTSEIINGNTLYDHSGLGGSENYYSILNLVITQPTFVGDYVSYSLFASMFGTIEHINFVNYTINSSEIESIDDVDRIFIAGLSGNANLATFNDVHLDLTIAFDPGTQDLGQLYIAGLYAYGSGDISYSSTTGDISTISVDYDARMTENYIAGMVGYATTANISYAINNMNIEGFSYQSMPSNTTYMGGLFAYAHIDSMYKVVNHGDMTSHLSGYMDNIYVGGIIGYQANLENEVEFVYQNGDLSVSILSAQTTYLAGYGYVTDEEATIDLSSVTNNGDLDIDVLNTLTETTLSNIDTYVSGVLITYDANGTITGLFNKHNLSIDLSIIDIFAGNLLALDQSDLVVSQSYQSGELSFLTTQTMVNDEVYISGNLYGKNLSMNHIRQEEDITIYIFDDTSSSLSNGHLYVFGLFEEVSQGFYATNGFQGGNIIIDKGTSLDVSYDISVSGIAYANRNTDIYTTLEIDYDSVDIDAIAGSMDTMLNSGNITVDNNFDGHIKASGILTYNESILSNAINTGGISIFNDVSTSNDKIEAAGLVYAMLGQYAQIRDSANNGDIKVASSTTLGYAHAAGIAVRNDVLENGNDINSSSLNQFAKIWFSINYGDVYAYNGTNESSYSIATETRSKASGILAIGILSIINNVNYGNVYGNYLAAGLFGFIYYSKFPSIESDQVYISNSINYGKVRRVIAFSTSSNTYTFSMSTTPPSGTPYAFGAIVGKIHTGGTTWEFAGDVDYPVDTIYFGYLLNFDSLIDMFASAPDLSSSWTSFFGDLDDANLALIQMVQYMATTNPSDDSVEPFTYFYAGSGWLGSYIGQVIEYYDVSEDDDGMFYNLFPFRDSKPANTGTDQYIADFIQYIPEEKVNTQILTKIESDTSYSYPGIYALSSSSGISNGIFIPDSFDFEGLNPYTLSNADPDETWIGDAATSGSIAYDFYTEMRQIKVSFATTIYNLEIEQTDQYGNPIANGVTLSDPVIDEDRSLITYYMPSNADVLGTQTPQLLTVSRYIEVNDAYVDGARVVANLLTGDNALNGYTYVGTHKKSGSTMVAIGPYATTGVYNLTTYDSSPYDSSSRNTPVYDLTNASSAIDATSSIFTHEPHVNSRFLWWTYWDATGYRVSRTTASSGYGAYKSFSLSGYPTLYEYVGPSTEAVTYVLSESVPNTVVYPTSNIYFSANTADDSYTISDAASLTNNGQSLTTTITIPRSYGIYDSMYSSGGTYIDSVEDHYGSVRVYSASYNSSDPSTYQDYEIRIIRTDDVDITDVDSLFVNGVASLPNSYNVHNVFANNDLYYETSGSNGMIEINYDTYNLADEYNVINDIEVFDNNTGVKVVTSLYKLSDGDVYTDNDFDNDSGTWGTGTVKIIFEAEDDLDSGDYYIELSLLSGETFKVNFTKMESANADVLSLTYQEELIEPITNSYTSYVDYGIYYIANDSETSIVDFTNLSSLTNISYADLETTFPNYLESLEISYFAEITSISFNVSMYDSYRHQYTLVYHITAEDGSTNTFTHYIIEREVDLNPSVVYKNGGSLDDQHDTVLVYYDESPTIRFEYDFDHVYFASDDILSVVSTFSPLNSGDSATEGIDYFIQPLSYIGFEVDLNQDTAKGDYTFTLSYSQSETVNGQSLSWQYTFSTLDLTKLKNNNSNIENVLFASDSVFDEVLDAFVTIVDIDEVTPTEYLMYFDETNPTQRLISVLPTTGIDYGYYNDYGNYWIIGQVQETDLTAYSPTFYIPDGASIYRVTDENNIHYDYQSSLLFADFSDYGSGATLNYVQYRVYAEDYDENPTHYTDYYIAVQDTTNNIKYDITVVNDTNDEIERVHIGVNVYQLPADYTGDLYYEDILVSMGMFSYYDSDTDTYDNNQFSTSMYGYYVLHVDVPEGYSVEIEYEAIIIIGDTLYLESSRIPRRYYVTIHIVEETPQSPDWGYEEIVDYTPQALPLDINYTYSDGEQFVYNGVTWEVLNPTYTYSQYNPPGTGSWQGLHDTSGIYNSASAYEEGDIVEYNGVIYIALNDNATNNNPVAGLGGSWNEISEDWLSYNLYTLDDIVLYNGVYYISTTSWNKNYNPASTTWAWTVYTN